MGLLSWFFPGPEERVKRARAYIDRGQAQNARFELLDVDSDDARAVLVEAEGILALRNIEAAVQYARTGDDVKAGECLMLAETFHHGGLEAEFQAARRETREIRAARSAAEEAAKAEASARLLAVDPLGMTGGPSWLDPVADPSMFDADRDEIEQRLALVVENYPESLRATVADLGPDFGQAVLLLDENRAEEALRLLVALPDDSALVCWERARAAHNLGDAPAAANAVRAFAKIAGSHHPIGRTHSGVYLAELLTETRDFEGALRVLRDVRTRNKALGAFLFAQLLFATGALEEAEKVLTGLVKQHPSEAPLYALLARVRIAGGERNLAMRALEQGLSAVCCTPGKCGSKAPDLDSHRLLATLYLEERVDTERGLELASKAAGLVQQPVWDDAYLAALAAKVRADPEADRLAQRLLELTPPEHPGVERATRLLAAPA